MCCVLNGRRCGSARRLRSTGWVQISNDFTVVTSASASTEALTNAGVDLTVALSLGIAGIVMVVTCCVNAIRCVRLIAQRQATSADVSNLA
jgi:hypothetical protein